MEAQPKNTSEESEGAQYLSKATASINTWSDELTVDHVRVSLLCSIYFMEENLRSPGWVWLGAAVRIAQDIGLHTDNGPYPPLETEMRRRVWWSVYNWDRIISLEIGRPLLIDDGDCDVSEPVPVDDDCIKPTGIVMPPPGQTIPSGLLAVIPVVRTTAQVKKCLKSPTVAASTLATCDEHFKSIMATWPDPYPIQSQAPLDPRLLTAGCSLQTQRLFLYRHNLSTASRPSERRDALDRCVSVARDTAHYVQRSLQHPSTLPGQGYLSPGHIASWAGRVRTMCPAFFCTHLWRCELVLCLRGDFAGALTLTHVSAAIGDLRKNNVGCGRFLAFFLDRLIGRLRAGASFQNLETDEEMLAYASGDMQGCADDAWAWNGSETGSNLHQPQAVVDGAGGGDRPALQAEQLSTSTLSDREAEEWGGWEHIQRTLDQLLQDQQGQGQGQGQPARPQSQQPLGHQGAGTYPPAPPPQQSSLNPPQFSQPGPQSPGPHSISIGNGTVNGNGSSSRISIKDII
ncbi:hypothetical protein DOTSEDRAFT_69887 [Dothistroma septosporum NZE10]|uniref:Xylanolytic transcriptional activator regulatory domain-containing protein n=1 Tax=Dothistroma septosporum (strain NZE10 / CBS 128990) TaxID=675120 RepID=N1Q0W5_DOTSN|nr:hypothetical protein DOTSEDRAFT_69887 [Dothistroma septosporum NZE10]